MKRAANIRTRTNGRGAEPKKITASLPPPTELSGTGGPWIPPDPKPIKPPLYLPQFYPNYLVVHTWPIIHRAFKKFQDEKSQNQGELLLNLCKYVVSELTPHLCDAVAKGELRPDAVNFTMRNLVDLLLSGNCDNREELIGQTMMSNAWASLESALIQKPQPSQPPIKPQQERNQTGTISNAQEPKKTSTTDNQEFDPQKYGGVVTCIVVSYAKDGQKNSRKLGKIVRNKAKQNVPKDINQWAYRIRKKACNEGWWEHIPRTYWRSYN